MTKCTHDDCFTCPYPDCIESQQNIIRKGNPRKRTKYKDLPEERKEAMRQASKANYYKNQERRKAYMREYYRTHTEQYKQKYQEKKKRSLENEAGGEVLC